MKLKKRKNRRASNQLKRKVWDDERAWHRELIIA